MNKKAQRGPVFAVLIIMTIIIITLLSAVWLGYGKFKQSGKTISAEEISPETKLIFTFVGIVILIYGWFSFYRQKNRGLSQTPTTTNHILTTAHKISGWYLSFKAIMGIITAIVLFTISILIYAGIFVQDSTRIYFATFLLIISTGMFIWFMVLFFRSRTLTKGQYY